MLLKKFLGSEHKTLYFFIFKRLLLVILIKKFLGIRFLINRIKKEKNNYFSRIDMNNYEIQSRCFNLCNYLKIKSCLVRSCLSILCFKNNLSDAMTFNIGIKKIDNKFSSHSWTTLNSILLNDDQDYVDSYSLIYTKTI